MYLILHPILHNFIHLPLLPKYKQNPKLYYNDLINLSFRLSNLSTGQLAKCEREVWQELADQYLELDYYQANIYYDTWSSIAKLVVQNRNMEDPNANNTNSKKANKTLGSRSNSSLNTTSSDDIRQGKIKSKKNKLGSSESLTNMNEETVEFERSNYIWGWPFFLTFLFYQHIEVKEGIIFKKKKKKLKDNIIFKIIIIIINI